MLIKNNPSSTTLRLLSLASVLSHAENKWAGHSLKPSRASHTSQTDIHPLIGKIPCCCGFNKNIEGVLYARIILYEHDWRVIFV